MGEPRGGRAKRSGAPLRAKARLWDAAEGAEPAATTAARNGAPHGTRESPAFPVRHATGTGTQRGPCNLDTEQLTGMSNDEIADPIGKCRPSIRDGLVASQRLLQSSPFRVGEAHEHSVSARIRNRRPPELRHMTF